MMRAHDIDWGDGTSVQATPLSEGRVTTMPETAAPMNEGADHTKDPGSARRVGRTVELTAASGITVRPVRWLWQDRIALGSFNLLGGREGIGKSIVECTIAADISRGRLPGVYQGTPKSVIIAAVEDTWEHTIVPRLMAAGADLERVYRIDVTTSEGVDAVLSLPRDLASVESLIVEHDVAAVMLDPVLSRLDSGLDTHRDAEVRRALEPLAGVASRTGCTVLGLIHVSKGASTDPLTMLMASRAFAAVARAVLFVMIDPDDHARRLLGQPKNNYGRTDLPTLRFRIDSHKVADTPEGPVWTGRLAWTGEADTSIEDALQQATEVGTGNRTATAEAADWLHDYLTHQGGSADSVEIKRAATKAGHAVAALQRARTTLHISTASVGFPRRTHWTLQSSHPPVVSPVGESDTNERIETTAAKRAVSGDSSCCSRFSRCSRLSPSASATTEVPDHEPTAYPPWRYPTPDISDCPVCGRDSCETPTHTAADTSALRAREEFEL
jgi:hypothetical protein